MAQESSSCASSQSRPLFSTSSSDSNPASPRTPSMCKEGRLDSTTEECCCATSPPLSPFAAAGEKGRSSRENDVDRSLIERLDEGWFWGNVMSCRWGHNSPRSVVVDGSGVATASDRLSEGSASSHGIRAPDAGGTSASQWDIIKPSSLRSIEMVPPLDTSRSFSGDRETRESRDLPRTRLRRSSKRPGSMDGTGMSFFEGEQQKPSSRASMNDTLRRFGEMRIEQPSRLGPVGRSKKPAEDVVWPSRPFSDGDERTEETNAPLSDVHEEEESAAEDKPLNKKQVPRKLVLPGKLAPIESGKELRIPLTDRNITKALSLTARKGRDRKKRSKSSTDADYDEMRGWIDLGFKIKEDDLTPRPLSGRNNSFMGGDDLFDSPRGLASPQGWPRRPDSPLLKLPIPAANGSGSDMREHLKQWAHYVASTVVSAEC